MYKVELNGELVDVYEKEPEENKIETHQFTIRRDELYEVLKTLSETETGQPIGLSQFKKEYNKLLEEGYDNFLTKLTNDQINTNFPQLDITNLHTKVADKLIKNNIHYIIDHIDKERLDKIVDIIMRRDVDKDSIKICSVTESSLEVYSKKILTGDKSASSLFLNEYFKLMCNISDKHIDSFTPEYVTKVLKVYSLNELLDFADESELYYNTITEFIIILAKKKEIDKIVPLLKHDKIKDALIPHVLNDILQYVYSINIHDYSKSITKIKLYKALQALRNEQPWLYDNAIKIYNIKEKFYYKLFI